ncbi:MAG: hypothetical protein ACHQX1_03595 [Candidatus Micrarchaeales archaeon]
MKKRGSLKITKDNKTEETLLFNTFMLSWEKIQNMDAQYMFKIACCFPVAYLIPIQWLGIVAGFDNNENTIVDPLGVARMQLQEWSLIEVKSQYSIQIHPLIREFGQGLMTKDQKEMLMRDKKSRLTDVVKSSLLDVLQLIENSLHPGSSPDSNLLHSIKENLRTIIKELRELEEAEVITLPSIVFRDLHRSLTQISVAVDSLEEFNVAVDSFDMQKNARKLLYMTLKAMQRCQEHLSKAIKSVGG